MKRTAEEAGLDEPDELPEEIDPKEIERMLAEADQVHVEALTEGSLNRMVLQLQKKIAVNQSERIKFPDLPEKFMKHECDLDDEVKKFKDLAASPHLYPRFVESGGVPILVGLMSHINTDITIGVVDVINALTESDTLLEVENSDEFIDALINANVCELLLDVINKLDETKSEEDAECISNVLGVVENLVEMKSDIIGRFSNLPKFLPWLLKRLRTQGPMNYNKIYASEIMGIFLQVSEEARLGVAKLDGGIEKLLRSIAVYRKKDPEDSEEVEYVQNVFNCLCSLMLVPDLQSQMGKSQGLELMIRMMKERNFSSPLALRLSDHATMGHRRNCENFVEKLGLKSLFAMFMKKKIKKKEEPEVEEHSVSIIASLCKHCTGMAVARVLNKFTENGFEKLERLLELHEQYARRLRKIAETENELMEDIAGEGIDIKEQKFLDKCESGLFTLQQVDIILVRIANMGNMQVQKAILHLLNMKGVEIEEIENNIKEYCANVSSKVVEEKKVLVEYLQFLRKE